MQQLMVRSTLVSLGLLAAISVSCSSGNINNVIPETCSVNCQDAEDNCVQKCSDNACKTNCMTAFNDCTLTCTRAQGDGG